MEEFALRRTLSDELHARAFHDFEGAGRFIRYVFLTDGDTGAILDYVNAFLDAAGRAPIPADNKFLRLDMDGYALRVEQHTEFMSVSFVEKGHRRATGLLADAFDPGITHLPLAWARGIPAPVFHAIWLEIGGKPPRGLTPERMTAIMDSRAIASNHFSNGDAQLHFAFDIDAAGFSRIALFNQGISPNRMGRVVQRVVELETYRLLALLGFAAVRDNSRSLGSIERAVGSLTTDMAAQIKQADGQVQQLLSVLSAQAADLEEIYSRTSYRLAATKAYEAILTDRIASLQFTRLEGFQGVRGFLGRRMTPALDSCRAFSARLSRLSERITRAGDLLQTQTEMIIQRQNRDLLRSMNARARHQLRLQQTVERLSIAAVTYYGVGLVGYLAKPLPLDEWHLDINLVKAAAVPAIAFLVWLAIRGVRAGLHDREDS
ncbi:MAG: DUF3422 family protein [Candidatus Puniceispirillaceae bacterium]|jgi:uncharacterized membrane-anchored protein